MKKYILESVKEYADAISFGMPGHKGKDYFTGKLKYDFTEFLGTDNLLNPHSSILQSQEEVAKIYGAKRSYYIPNGSSGALHIAISALTNPGDCVLVQRNAHKSIYNAMVLHDLNPVYLNANYRQELALFMGVTPEEVRKKIQEQPIAAAILVSPNFYGGILKLRELIEIFHEANIPVIVDEAHGAHLYFNEMRQYGAITCGADLVIHSTHKMIPSMTSTALLHVNSDRVSHLDVLKYMNLYLTTSPSYYFMISQEEGLDLMQRQGKERMEKIADAMEHLRSVCPIPDYRVEDDSIIAYDPMKYLFRIPGYSGSEIVETLLLRYNIRLEMGDLYYSLALFSALNEVEDIAELERAILELSKGELSSVDKMEFPTAKRILSPREAFYRESERVELSDCVGRISSGIVAAYPPGIPLVSHGEEITEEILRFIHSYQESGIEVIGMKDGKIEVVK